MNKKMICLLVGSIFLIEFSIGCQENQSIKTLPDNVTLISSVVELVNGTLEYKKGDNDEINRVIVSFLFHNIAGRVIDRLNITARFYDKQNTLIWEGAPKYLENMLADYTEQFDPTFNTFVYVGDDAKKVDHVVLFAVEES